MLIKLIDYYCAIKHIPIARLGWRVYRRTQRSLYQRFPKYFFRKIFDSASIYKKHPDFRKFNDFSYEKHRLESLVNQTISLTSDQSGIVSIQGKIFKIDAKNTGFGIPESSNYLDRMTISYFNYLILLDYSDGKSQCFLEYMIDAVCSIDALSRSRSMSIEWHPYAVSQRLISLVTIASLVKRQQPSNNCKKLVGAIVFHRNYLANVIEYELHFNHLAKNYLALSVADMFLGIDYSDKWINNYIDCVEHQILADGGHAELCPMYHFLVLFDLVLASKLVGDITARAVSERIQKLIGNMLVAGGVMSFSNSEISLFSDSWTGEAPPIDQLFKEYSRDYKSGDSLGVNDGLIPEDKGRVSVDVLPDTGYIKYRWKKAELIMDVGAVGPLDAPGHGHDDFLSIEIAIAKKRWIVDYGVESYSNGSARVRTRSAGVHNAPKYPGKRGINAWSSFRVGRRSDSPKSFALDFEDDSVGWLSMHSPIDSKGCKVSRSIVVNSNLGILILDYWEGFITHGCLQSEYILAQSHVSLEKSGYVLKPIVGQFDTDKETIYFDPIGVENKGRLLVHKSQEGEAAMLLQESDQLVDTDHLIKLIDSVRIQRNSLFS